MCGIAGFTRGDDRDTQHSRDRLGRMLSALRHRGPDGAGIHVDGPVALGHRRLAVIDIAGGHQPMSTADGRVWITFNGEIYNHEALRRSLESKGHQYATRSDTETILHLYEEYGEGCIEHLQGMFAFALWDRDRRQLLLARDRLGIKPLYYALNGDGLLFASEIKALVAGGLRPELNREMLPEYLASRYVSGEGTLFKGVSRLGAGCLITWSPAEGVRQRRYWALPQHGGPPPASYADAADEVRTRLREAVRSHLMSDVPLGLFLSGGLDSAGLLALMAPLATEPVRTFSVGFADRDADELAYARLAARAAGAIHRETVVSPDDFFAQLPRLIWHEDEPLAFPSSVPLYFVSRLAREDVTVVLSGEGADELFLGYNRYRVSAWNERLGASYRRLVPAVAQRHVKRLANRLPYPLGRYVTRSFVATDSGPRAQFCENFSVFSARQLERVLAEPALIEARDRYGTVLQGYNDSSDDALNRMSRADLQTYLVRLLAKQDQMSMAASIESRVPFLDHTLVERVVTLPAHFKLRGFTTKAVLRDALEGLVPAAILARPKMGFPVPVGRWLRSSFARLVDEFVLGHRSVARGLFDRRALLLLAAEHRATGAHGDRLWLLLNLEIWHRVFIDGEDVAHLMRAA